MIPEKTRFENSLLTRVLETGKCTGCGKCVINCPFGCLKLEKGKVSLIKECKACGSCAQVCPRYVFITAKAEDFVYGRTENPQEEFGIYRRIAVIQSKGCEIQRVAQNGGAVTGHLVAALQSGLIDGAIVTGKSQEKPFLPVPLTQQLLKRLFHLGGTKHTCSPSLMESA